MADIGKRLFVGLKISPQLQRELDNCARGMERYLKEGDPESLQIVKLGEEKLIGRFLKDGFPVRDIENVSRNVRSILTLITKGHQMSEDSIRIYVDAGDVGGAVA